MKKENKIDFYIEKRGDVHVLVWNGGGCGPATRTEIAMWNRIKELENAIEGALKICQLWAPPLTEDFKSGNPTEYQALSSMYAEFKRLKPQS